MKKTLLVFFFSVVLYGTTQADLGMPTIQAICRVKLIDGGVIEGIITFGRGGYDASYKPNGFCYIHDNGVKQLDLYRLYFNLEPYNLAIFRSGKSKLYYVNNISEQRDPKRISEFDEEQKILTNTYIKIRKYEFLEKMPMYIKLPISMYVGSKYNKEEDKIFVEVNNIKSVVFLRNPSQKWLDIIEMARKDLKEVQRIEEWEDYKEPAWYHEFITNKEMVNYLNSGFR